MPSRERLKAQELCDAARWRLPDLHAEQMKRLVAEVMPKLISASPLLVLAKKGIAGASNF